MHLKSKLLLKRLPYNNFNISKTAREVGYTVQGSKSGTLYRTLRNSTMIKEMFSDEQVKKEIEQAKKKFIKDNDNTNYARMIELKSKISIPELRRQEITQTNPDKIIITYGNKSLPDDKSKEENVSPTEK